MDTLRSNFARVGANGVCRYVLSGAAVALAVAGDNALADALAVPGHAILARVSGKALVVWDATPEIAAIVAGKIADGAAADRLERDALDEVAAEEPKLGAATDITVRVTYTKSGAVSPVYGSATFEGIERYATVEMSMTDARTDRDRWKEAAASTANLPRWIAFKILGQLPSRS